MNAELMERMQDGAVTDEPILATLPATAAREPEARRSLHPLGFDQLLSATKAVIASVVLT